MNNNKQGAYLNFLRGKVKLAGFDGFHAEPIRYTGPGGRMNIDWQKAALNIRSQVPLEVASKKMGHYKGWLNQVARGEIAEPKFMDGLNLLNLHLDLCGAEKHREIMRGVH